MRRRLALCLMLALLFSFPSLVATQSPQLRIVEASPRGEVNQLADANEIRIVFSEPMVALGRVPSNPAPSWVRITPAVAGKYRWSGTSVLVFTPDSGTPLPYATRFTLTVDASATSVAGRRLGAPYEVTFTTPTVKLTSLRWYRREGRVDRPAVLVLDFNQRVRAAAVAAHTTARYTPHEWEEPGLPAPARARLATIDPTALRAFDAKVGHGATGRGAAGSCQPACDHRLGPPALPTEGHDDRA